MLATKSDRLLILVVILCRHFPNTIELFELWTGNLTPILILMTCISMLSRENCFEHLVILKII